MDTRQILQVVLAVIILAIVGLGGVLIYQTFATGGQTVVVEEIVDNSSDKEQINPWATLGPKAIEIVQRERLSVPEDLSVLSDEDKEIDDAEMTKTTIGELIRDDAFIKDILKLDDLEKVGWEATWWGETRYGESFYLVRYAFKDAHITVGPAWLVDYTAVEAVPKNIMARVVTDPVKAIDEEHYDKHQQVVSALASHRFESGLTLGGALLMHFEQREDSEKGDTILGWTIEHDRNDLFKAYFQWVEAGEPTYAEFEFDYDKKALKASNLQAADVMRIGEDFDKTQRADIKPESYDPNKRGRRRWTKGACKRRPRLGPCRSLAAMVEQAEIVEALEWLLTAQAESAEVFEECKEAKRCKWGIKEKDGADDTYLISYIYDLEGKEEKRVGWEVALKKGDSEIKPTDRISTAAWRAINPRN